MSVLANLFFAAGIPWPGESDYRSRMQALLAQLDALSYPCMPTSPEEYAALSEIRSELSSLSCYTSNIQHPQNDRVWKLESEYCALQRRYNRHLELKRGIDRSLARYLLWRRAFGGVNPQTCFLEARDRGLLRRADNDALFVVGLNPKRGDNTFTVNDEGRHWRQYYNCIGNQALAIERSVPFAGADRAAFLATVPTLDPSTSVTWVGDGKGLARPIALSRKEREAVYQLLTEGDQARAPQLVPATPMAPSVVPQPPLAPHQDCLFSAAA